MKNKNVGYLILGIGILILIIIFIFNNALKDIVGETCSHGPTCTMFDTIQAQTWLSLAIAGVVIFIGIFFIFAREEKEIVIKKVTKKIKVTEKPIKIDYSKLKDGEKVIVRIIEEEKGSIFQSELVEKSGFDKVKVTRILDRLEGMQILTRKRRGMSNMVILKKG